MSANLQIASEADPQARIAPEEMDVINVWQTIGAIKLANSLAASLSSQTIHALERVRDDKSFARIKVPGSDTSFSTFDSFLDKHPASPMSHETFRRRANLLKEEGDTVFDLLNSLKVPINKRKLLANGDIEVSGDEMKIGDRRLDLTDRGGIVLAINDLAEERNSALLKVQEQERTIERGKNDIKKYKRKLDEAQEEILRGATVSENGAPHARRLVSLLGEFQLLAEEVASLRNDDELKRFAPLAFEHIAEAQKRLEFAFGHKAPETNLEMSDEDKEKLIASES